MVRETRLTPEHLIYPLFVTPGEGVRKEIPSLPGCFHLSVDEAAREAEEVEKLGVGGVILFGLPASKDPVGSEGYADDGVVQEATRAIRKACGELLVVTGRGWGNRTQEPILRRRVEAWLRGPDGRRLGVKDVQVVSRGGALEVRLGPPG